jgi:predicted RNA-binding protein YlxR (DUF448 family)
MCVVCRGRFFQHELIRLQCKGDLVFYTGSGRSFYVCQNCIKDKKFAKKVAYLCKISKEKAQEKIEILLKEYT